MSGGEFSLGKCDPEIRLQNLCTDVRRRNYARGCHFVGDTHGPWILKQKCLKRRHVKYRSIILAFAVTVHLLAAALCLLPPKKFAEYAQSWAKQAKSTVNMERHKKRRCKLDPLFSI
jgi:hypothetical protein